MELALHLRQIQRHPLDEGLKHLKTFYEESELALSVWEKHYSGFSRIYAGDEFCVNRLPDTNEVKKIVQFCEDHHLGLSFLLPPLSDLSVDQCRPTVQYLSETYPATEIVVNDAGALFFIKKNYPKLTLSMGRLFNKGFKDPRFNLANHSGSLSADVRQLLNECTFDQQAVIDMARQLSIVRMEQDLFPYAENKGKRSSGIDLSIYFPFGYITSGRICRISAFHKKGRKKFLIDTKCNQLCNGLPLLLKNDDARFTLLQNGNTIFYLYPPAVLKRLLNDESGHRLRLVYQGFALT